MSRFKFAFVLLAALGLFALAACGQSTSSSSSQPPTDDDGSPDDDASPADDDDFGFLVFSANAMADDDDDNDDASPGDAPFESWLARADAPMAQPTILSQVAGHNVTTPTVSPDGTTVVFSANYEKDSPAPQDPPGGNLYQMPAAGGQWTRVTSENWMAIYEVSPAFSPDGSKLAYVRTDGTQGALQGIGKIYITDLSGATPTPAIPDDTEPFNESDPVFSPDGSKLAFISGQYSNGTSTGDVMLEDLQNPGAPVRLTTTAPSPGDSNAVSFFDATGQWVYYEAARKTSATTYSYTLNRVSTAGGDPQAMFNIPSVSLPWADQAAQYSDFRATHDFTHAVCVGVIDNTYGIDTIDSLAGAIAPAAATNLTADIVGYAFWWRP